MGTIQKQGILNTLIIYSGVALGFINTIIIQPNLLETDEVGLFRLFISFSSLLTPFILLGSSNTCTKFYPTFNNRAAANHGFLGLLLLIVLVGCAVTGVGLYLMKDWILSKYALESALFVRFYAWVFPTGVLMTLTIVVNAYCNSIQKSVFSSFVNDIVLRVFLIAISLFYYFDWLSLSGFVSGILIAHLLQLLLLGSYVIIRDRPSLRINWEFTKSVGISKIAGYSLLMSLTAFSSLSLKFLDSIMIGAYLPLTSVGIYAIGMFLAQFIETPLTALERVVAVHISNSFTNNTPEKIAIVYEKSVRYMLLLGGFLSVCIITNVNDFLSLLPPDYASASSVCILLSLGAVINMATGVNSSIINNSSKYYVSMIFMGILIVIAVTLNILLIPRYGIAGAAIATGVSSIVFNIMKLIYIRKVFKLQPYTMATLKIIFILVLAFFGSMFVVLDVNTVLLIFIRGTVATLITYLGIRLLHILPEFNYYIQFAFLKKPKH